MLHACLTLVNSSVSRYDFLLRSREGVILGIHKRTVQFQLTRNLFLTLHGHNVRRQQQQLSKFLMRYQQFATDAYYGAAGPNSKMESQQEEAFCVLRFEVSRSVITVQREFRARFRKDASDRCTEFHSTTELNLCFDGGGGGDKKREVKGQQLSGGGGGRG